MNLFDDLADICRRGVPLAPLTWYRLGGPADYLIEPRNEAELGIVIRRCNDANVPLRILGFGANVLVSDAGFRGVVVRLTADAFTSVEYQGNRVIAGAGLDLTRLVRNTVRRGLAGLENLAGIPGTVGGGIRMNCGGRYGEIGTAVRVVSVVGTDGELITRDRDDLDFAYRHSALGRDWVVRVEFGLQPTDPHELVQRFREIWMYKQNTQPPLGANSAGCIFRNPPGQSAGMLIDRAGLKGLRIGSAHVSERHANFLLADKHGKASDVARLIQLVADRVEEHSGIRLRPEIEIW